jgi:quinol monooxygenase YgiN
LFTKESGAVAASELLGIARFKLHGGKIEEYERLSAQCMEIVRTKDTGMLQCEISFSHDESEDVVLERYRDSEALTEHSENISHLMEPIMARARSPANSSVSRAQSSG